MTWYAVQGLTAAFVCKIYLPGPKFFNKKQDDIIRGTNQPEDSNHILPKFNNL